VTEPLLPLRANDRVKARIRAPRDEEQGMAVAFEMRFAGGTLAQYDAVIERMGFTHGGTGAEGGLFHWVAETEDGILVVDVWESDEAFEAFGRSTLMPITAELGVAPPEVTRRAVYNTLVGPRVTAAV
jgi:hypothetical protein